MMRSEREPFTADRKDSLSTGDDTAYTGQVAMDTYVEDATADGMGTAGYGIENASVDSEIEYEYREQDGTQVTGDEPMTVDGVVIPPQYVMPESVSDDTAHDNPCTPIIDQLPDGVEVINGVAYIKEDIPDRVQVVVRIDPDFKRRLSVIASLERRTMTVVVEEAIRIFMTEPVNEPRPYLPPELYGEQGSRLAFYMTSEDKYRLEARARSECRSVMDLVRRALADYVRASPYDPERYMRNMIPTETVQNRPTIEEDGSEVSEYLQPSEARLTPSKAQKTADAPSEEVTG